MGSSGPRPPPLDRLAAYFRRNPVMLLLAFTPGIPEYLSGSSSVALLAVNPFVFVLFLGLNLGLYGPGVLLVREAHVRWNRGWSTVLLLGAAYGLLEEGTALATLFNPKASVVGGLGTYGHAYGVSWVWLIGILGIHTVYSVGVPILLLGLALPETRGRPLLTGRRLPLTVGIYGLDIALLAYISHYATGAALLVGAALVAGALWLIAWRLPPGRLDPSSSGPRRSPRFFFGVGVAYFILLLLVPGIINEVGLPAYLAFAGDLVAVLLLFVLVQRTIGRTSNEAQLVVLALGLLAPLMTFGLLAQIYLPIVLVLDVFVGFFFLRLWRRYRPTGPAQPPLARAPVA